MNQCTEASLLFYSVRCLYSTQSHFNVANSFDILSTTFATNFLGSTVIFHHAEDSILSSRREFVEHSHLVVILVGRRKDLKLLSSFLLELMPTFHLCKSP